MPVAISPLRAVSDFRPRREVPGARRRRVDEPSPVVVDHEDARACVGAVVARDAPNTSGHRSTLLEGVLDEARERDGVPLDLVGESLALRYGHTRSRAGPRAGRGRAPPHRDSLRAGGVSRLRGEPEPDTAHRLDPAPVTELLAYRRDVDVDRLRRPVPVGVPYLAEHMRRGSPRRQVPMRAARGGRIPSG